MHYTRIAAALAAGAATLITTAGAASADTGQCATWGCGGAQWDSGSKEWIVTVDDVKEDGACVGTLLLSNGQPVRWGPTSCGDRVTARVDGSGTNAVRIVRGGRFLTVAGG